MKSLSPLIGCLLLACTTPTPPELPMQPTAPAVQLAEQPYLTLDRDTLYDKVLGLLVGSAIGDAMGAPTEMWSRYRIQLEYGYVDSLTDVTRGPSPEGTWTMNLPAGGTTDDTRWKYLLGTYYTQTAADWYAADGPDPYRFASYLVDSYRAEIDALKRVDAFDPAPFELQARRMAWLQEWALVARPFAERDLEGYTYARDRFYGGEVTCAGMLYTPVVGVAYPGAPEHAYDAAYRLSLFDHGYARDISALTAAMVAGAFDPAATPESLLRLLRTVDMEHFFESRLVGRSSYELFTRSRAIVQYARRLEARDLANFHFRLPVKGRDSLRTARLQHAYEALDRQNENRPFHASEIQLIHLTALQFCDFDFSCAMEFVTNYGRDNDTVAAVTGALLGTYHGYAGLPEKLTRRVISVNHDRLGIDLEALATTITDALLAQGAVRIR